MNIVLGMTGDLAMTQNPQEEMIGGGYKPVQCYFVCGPLWIWASTGVVGTNPPQMPRRRLSTEKLFLSLPNGTELSHFPPTLATLFLQLHQWLRQHRTAPAFTKTIPFCCPPLSCLPLPLPGFSDPAAYHHTHFHMG